MEQYKDNCLTCKSWHGDKESVKQKIDRHGDVVMDWVKGFADFGICKENTDWAEITIDGDATASLELPANFGCILHSERGG